MMLQSITSIQHQEIMNPFYGRYLHLQKELLDYANILAFMLKIKKKNIIYSMADILLKAMNMLMIQLKLGQSHINVITQFIASHHLINLRK